MGPYERMFRHEHAHKLDDPEREKWLPISVIMKHLGCTPGMMVADIGAGTGYFTIPMARAVAPGGQVFAGDTQPEMLARLRARLEPGLPVVPVEGEANHTTLADHSVDLVFYANVWHEVDDRTAALVEAARILRPGGKIAILDWRPDVEQPPGTPGGAPDPRRRRGGRALEGRLEGRMAAHGWGVHLPRRRRTLGSVVSRASVGTSRT